MNDREARERLKIHVAAMRDMSDPRRRSPRPDRRSRSARRAAGRPPRDPRWSRRTESSGAASAIIAPVPPVQISRCPASSLRWRSTQARRWDFRLSCATMARRRGAVERARARAEISRIERTCSVKPAPSAGKAPSSAAVPTVKPAAPASAAAVTRSSRSMLPAMMTGFGTASQTRDISRGTSPRCL